MHGLRLHLHQVTDIRIQMHSTNHHNRPVLAIAVDLLALQPGGANGGLKPAVFSLIAEVTRQMGDGVVWVFLTNTKTHAEVRGLARSRDILVCLDQNSGADFEPLELPAPAEFKLFKQSKDLVAKLGVDLLYCPFGDVQFQVEGIPTVAFIVDLLHRDYPQTLTTAQIKEREHYIGHTVDVASMIQCTSRSSVERLMARYQVPEERLFHTYLPVHVRLESDGPPCGVFTRELGVRGPYFFYPANLWKHKNHETLLLAYRLYRERSPAEAWELVLTFHEDGNHVEFRKLIEALGISEHVHCPGYVSEEGLRALWHGAGALVFPSLHEGFGIPMVEAMYYGIPIIAGWDFSLKEIGGDACHRVDSRKPESIANGLLKVSGDAPLREALVAKGRQRLNFFDLTVETAKLVDVFRSVPGRSGGFPRKPKVLENRCAVTVPCPASGALWDLEISVHPGYPQNRYSFYLDDAAFGSYSVSPGAPPVLRFRCRPLGRVLRAVISRDRTYSGEDPANHNDAIREIVATRPSGEHLVLFASEKEKTA